MKSSAVLIAIVLLSASSSRAALYTAVNSGDWSNQHVWGDVGSVPGDGDTCAIADGVTLTVSDTRICGNSPTAGTVVFNWNFTGVLVITGSGNLKLRGDGQFCGTGSDSSNYLSLQAGSTFEFDSSLNPTQKYSSYTCASFVYRRLTATGTPTAHVTIQSNAGGANGYFGLNGHAFGGGVVLTYTDVIRIGDAINPAFSQMTGVVDGGTPWNATHSTFTDSGLAPSAGCSLGPNEVFRHSFNYHVRSQGASAFTRPDACGGITAIGSGVREIAGNVFDKIADTNLDARDFTITSNYLTGDQQAITIVNYIAHSWAKWQNNFYRVQQGSVGMLQMQGDVLDSYFVLDEPNSINPHGLVYGGASGQVVTGSIGEHTGTLTSSRSAFILNNVILASALYSMTNNILTPNAANGMTFWLSAIFSPIPGSGAATFAVNHNTTFATSSDGAMIVVNHNPDVTSTHQIASLKNNIVYNGGSGPAGYKVLAESDSGIDSCDPAECDYNNGWNTNTGGGGFTNGGNGYAAHYSVTPGAHDLAVNPMFKDSSRTMATFDSAYLGNHPTPWNSGATYSVGDMVSSSDSTVYGGATINYRWTNNAGCSGNTKPGLYTSAARACWEWATLYRIREGVRLQTLYDDQTIGASGVDIITVLIGWMRAGWSPRHPSLAMGGSDGLTIGAVQASFNPPTFPASSNPTKLRNMKTREGRYR